jgi:hypothetical protein
MKKKKITQNIKWLRESYTNYKLFPKNFIKQDTNFSEAKEKLLKTLRDKTL